MTKITIEVEVSRIPDKTEQLYIESAVEEMLSELGIEHELANIKECA